MISLSFNELELIRKYLSNPAVVDIICLFGKYPFAHFSLLAVARYLNSEKTVVATIIDGLIDSGVLMKTLRNGVTFYSLNYGSPLDQTIRTIAGYNWLQRRLLVEEIKGNSAPEKENNRKKTGIQPSVELYCIRPIIKIPAV